MDLADLAALTGKSIDEVKSMLDDEDVISVNLTERKSRAKKKEESGMIEVMG